MQAVTVNIKDLHPSAMTRIIKCKKITSLQDLKDQKFVTLGGKQGKESLQLIPIGEENEVQIEDKTVETSKADSSTEHPNKKIRLEEDEVELIENMEGDNTDESQMNALDKVVVEMGQDGEEIEEVAEYTDDMADLEDDMSSDVQYENVYADAKLRRAATKRRMSRDEDYEYIPSSAYRAKRSSAESYASNNEKRKVKPKLFRSEWLNIDIFKDWLDRDPTNPYKARCVACNTVMNAGKSELEKHATGARHTQAVAQMHRHMMMYNEAEEEEEEEEDEDEDDDDSTGEIRTVPNTASAENPVVSAVVPPLPDQSKEVELEVLNRIATSIDTLSTNMVLVLEKISSTQETLTNLMQQIFEK